MKHNTIRVSGKNTIDFLVYKVDELRALAKLVNNEIDSIAKGIEREDYQSTSDRIKGLQMILNDNADLINKRNYKGIK